ncbi:MAG TPA: vWA domain-containing protein [Nannocystaceae bacterium]|nr:vWA domain-containing protein [Nannocystaceae bacterium]
MPRRALPTSSCLVLALVASACTGESGNGDASASESGMITSASQGTSQTTSTSSASTSGSSTTGASGSASESEGTGTTADTGTSSTSGTSGTSADASTSAAASTGSTTADTNTTGEVQPCQVESSAIEPIPSDILFVLDKSGSMSMELWDHDKNLQTPMITRWKSLHTVVSEVVSEFESKLHFGAKLFPKIDAGSFYDQGACVVLPGVEVPIAAMNAAELLMGIPAADFAVLGGTPSYQGLKEGYTYLKALNDGLARAVIFITDGEISCDNPPAAAIAAISAAWEKDGVPTYVVGVDIDEQTAAQLDQFALAGGKPVMGGQYHFYQTLDQIDLEKAMQKILDDTVSCVLPVDPEPDQPDLFEVWLDGAEIPRVTDCAKESGWVWSKEFTEITVCGDACSALKKGGAVEAKYYCIAG